MGWNHCCTFRGSAALVVEGLGLLRQHLEDGLHLLLQLVDHGLDVSLHPFGDLSGQWRHLGPDGPVLTRRDSVT